MHRIDNATSAAALPTPQPVGPNPDGFFQSQAIVEADWLNSMQEEVANVIESESIVLDKTLRNQLLDAITTKIINAAAPRYALVYNSVQQSIPNATLTNLTWDTELEDTYNIHSTSVNTDRLTVPIGVTKIKLSANAIFLNNAAGIRQLVLHKNANQFLGGPNTTMIPTPTGYSIMNIASPILTVTPGDFFTAVVFQDSGVALNAGSLGGIGQWFCMEIITR